MGGRIWYTVFVVQKDNIRAEALFIWDRMGCLDDEGQRILVVHFETVCD